jgi:serine/threonine-protein kinase
MTVQDRVPPARLVAALERRYVLEREFGRGGVATVYLARDVKHDRPVALKVVNPELAPHLGVERFLREIEIVARLSHPHILPLYDSGAAGGFLFYVMPLVEGDSLRARLDREGRLTLQDAAAVVREVASALDYAHAQGVVHRDIKPENILLVAGHAVVADFGIARAVSDAAEGGPGRLTSVGVVLGTPAYMSPEQASGDPHLDGRSDVYSLACVAYEMLAGEPPFTGPTRRAAAMKRLTAPPPRLRAACPDAPLWVDRALVRAFAVLPAARTATAGELAAAMATPTLRSVMAAAQAWCGSLWRRATE